MSSPIPEAALSNYRFYQEAFVSCAEIGFSPTIKKQYKHRADFAAKLVKTIEEKFNEPGYRELIAEETKTLFDQTTAVWFECLEYGVERCELELNKYETFVDVNRHRYRSINRSPHSDKFSAEIDEVKYELAQLQANATNPADYLESWDASFQIPRRLHTALGATHAAMADIYDKAKAEQKENKENLYNNIRTGGALTGLGSALYVAWEKFGWWLLS